LAGAFDACPAGVVGALQPLLTLSRSLVPAFCLNNTPPSGKKEALANVGGLLCCNDDKLHEQVGAAGRARPRRGIS
jgi:hypothetical protein